MKIQTFKYVGNGQEQLIPLSFKPTGWFIFGDAAVSDCVGHIFAWCNRSNGMANEISTWSAARPAGTGLYVGSSVNCNQQGTTYYGCAIGDSATVDYEVQNHIGNATAGRQILLQKQAQPLAAIFVRDATESKLLWMRKTGTSVKCDGSGMGVGVTASSVGALTVDAGGECNKYSAASALGESHAPFYFFDGGSIDTIKWVGDGAAGRSLYTAPGQIKMVLCQLTSATGSTMRATVDTMDATGASKPTAAAIETGTLVISGNTLSVGSSPANINGAGKTYEAIVLYDKDEASKPLPTLITKGKRAVWLPGRDIASNIDCGVADSSGLKINGALTIEWYGALFPFPSTSPLEQCIIARHGAVSGGAVGSCSWGLEILNTQNVGLHWQSTMLHACVSDRFGSQTDLSIAAWRTGILPPFGLPAHWVLKHNGAGRWMLFRNGRLCHQRDIDMTNIAVSQGSGALPNIQSGIGHRTTIGARQGSSGITANTRMLHILGRVYNRELTMDEVATRFAISALGSSKSNDVTSGLAEEWDAANAGGNLVPATVNSANNGTINYGTVLTL